MDVVKGEVNFFVVRIEVAANGIGHPWHGTEDESHGSCRRNGGCGGVRGVIEKE